MLNVNKLKKIFKKNRKILKKEAKLEEKKEKIYKKMEAFAYYLYEDFVENISNLNKYEEYFYVHIEDKILFVEELRYENANSNMIEFKHNSPHRQNRVVNMYLNLVKKDYKSSSVIVNKEQFQVLSNNFKIVIRE